jgi:hypothetical protein
MGVDLKAQLEATQTAEIYDANGRLVGEHSSYGLRSKEYLLGDNGKPEPIAEFERLQQTARDELKAAGEQTDTEIVALFEAAGAPAVYNAIVEWTHRAFVHYGEHGRLHMAARFLGMVHLLAQAVAFNDAGRPAAIAAIRGGVYFADAWHKWADEVSGNHARAYYGEKAAEDHDKRDAERDKKRASRNRIIIAQVGHLLRGDTSSLRDCRVSLRQH